MSQLWWRSAAISVCTQCKLWVSSLLIWNKEINRSQSDLKLFTPHQKYLSTLYFHLLPHQYHRLTSDPVQQLVILKHSLQLSCLSNDHMTTAWGYRHGDWHPPCKVSCSYQLDAWLGDSTKQSGNSHTYSVVSQLCCLVRLVCKTWKLLQQFRLNIHPTETFKCHCHIKSPEEKRGGMHEVSLFPSVPN